MKNTGESPSQIYIQEIKEYMKRAVTPMFVLHLLSEKPMYPFQINLELRLRSGGLYSTSCYPTVQRLIREGYICEAGIVMSDNGSRRQSYTTTPAGRECMARLTEEYAKLHGIIGRITGAPGAQEVPDAQGEKDDE
jgi:DNA-binding PadR family transcriptional regulator